MIVKTEGSTIAQGSSKWLAMGQEQLPRDTVVEVAVSALSVADSPRVAGEDPEHIQTLAVAQGELPPILVHHSTMRVIDGIHRLRVAKLRGDEYIAARFFSGDEKDAFVLAVKSNITHGLPLSLTDRKAAAARIIGSHPQWSDRMIASVVGLAARTVGEIRRQDTREAVQLQSRIGQDGRVRPINAAGGRILAAQLIADTPGLSLREIARAAGISPETARDVRKRLGRGEDPVPGRRTVRKSEPTEKPGSRRVEPAPGPVPSRPSRESRAAVLERLKADPALRFTETGRTLLRLLHVHMIKAEEWENVAENIPPHCAGIIASLARECAQMWKEFADLVEHNLADIA